MSDNNNSNEQILNLDRALGAPRLKVAWRGREYPLRDAQALSAVELQKMMSYGARFEHLSSDAAMWDDGGSEILRAMDEVLEIIAPDLPRYKPSLRERIGAKLHGQYVRRFALSMSECAAILQFWSAQNDKKKARVSSRRR